MVRFSKAMLAALLNFAIIWFSLSPAEAQGFEETIVLKPQKVSFLPKEYFFNQIIDGRVTKGPIGSIIIAGGNADVKLLSRPINLRGGAAKAIEDLIKTSLPANPDLRAVVFNLKDLKISEEVTARGIINGSIQIIVSFETNRNNEPVNLVEYRGGSRYSRSANNIAAIGPVLVKNILNSLQYFNTWMNREAATHEKLAGKVMVEFNEFVGGPKSDTLFYSVDRPLGWQDFKSKPDIQSRFAAEIFTFFSFEESSKIENSIVYVGLKFKIYVVRSFSWVKDFARNPFTLNHEQRHFDIVKIVAERFKEKINKETLTVDNYQGILSVEYLESLREMDRLQQQYDDETRHGTDPAMQNKWDRRIDDELKIFNIRVNPE